MLLLVLCAQAKNDIQATFSPGCSGRQSRGEQRVPRQLPGPGRRGQADQDDWWQARGPPGPRGDLRRNDHGQKHIQGRKIQVVIDYYLWVQ